MLTLTIKQLIGSFFMFIYLVNTTTLAQPDFLSYFCENASNYTENSIYQRNLDKALSILPTTNSGFGFFNFPTGQGNNKVKSVALCRGDVNPDVCRSCLNDTIVNLRNVCPNQKEAIGYYDYCLLKYSNQTILEQTDFKFYVYLANTQNTTNIPGFNRALAKLLTDLKDDAATGGPLRKFATGNTGGPQFLTIYALEQCTPDLSDQECSYCLEGLINKVPEFLEDRVGGRILLPMCNIRYEAYQFFNDTTIPPPPSSPSLQPLSPIPQPE